MGQSASAEVIAPLFSSAHSALVFAFSFSCRAYYDRPIMNRMATQAIGSGKGLAGLDGAAQAGMLRAEVRALGNLHEALLIARIAPRSTPCSCGSPCCSGRRPNLEWVDAVAWLSGYARDAVLAGRVIDYRIARGCVEMYFASSLTVTKLADRCGVSRNTVGAYLARVRKMLRDSESLAQHAIDERLRMAGVIA